MREHLQSVLAPHFKVITADNGRDALKKMQTHQPALVLSDIMMPVLDGIGLLKEMKLNTATAQIPIILLTARAGEESKIAGWETGADDYLVKPFSSKELLARITAHIRTQRIRNEALQKAEQSSTELRELSALLEQKVNQRTKELDDTNRELRRINEELTEFAYVSSHDLQEPLRKIQMFSKRILEKELDTMSADAQELFVRMDNSARRMQLLINDLLTYSRTNTSQKHYVRTDLNDLLNEVKQELYEKIMATDTTIESDLLPTLPIIAFQFKQLFTNLLVNSIKFARTGVPPHISIKSTMVDGRAINYPLVKPERKYWHLSFTDNGTGFDPQFKEQVFGVFQRLHDRKEYEGTGIGLAIAKKVVENHDGIIAADGEENNGATIHIFLPEK
jgi:light-regulated signal transduction histidine kinase (bacteriophytochrome)